ncbi:MAG TPA: CPBP family intramembrane glutamic endopeptidase [Candidatus Limnocylindrales bacterium]|nr:CPBP family intramembrane glutamic endopeptidase [Candidatus Limnocylindrales bacterium]
MLLLLRIVVGLAALVAVRVALAKSFGGVITAAALLGTYAVFVRLTERRWPAELKRPWELGLGLLVGAGLCAVTILILYLLGHYHIDGTNPVSAIWPAVGVVITAGVFEELLLRGVLFRLLEEKLGSWLAVALSAAAFGALHLANPEATLFTSAAIALQAGVLLALAFMATRRLWLPIGMHVAWNFSESVIFGVPLSGFAYAGLLRSHLTGPPLISGGAFGVEGSALTVAICLTAAAALYRYARKNLKPFGR